MPPAFSHVSIRAFASSADSVRSRLAGLKQAKTPPKTEPLPPRKRPQKSPTPEHIARHQAAMKASFPSGWNPPRKISREAMDGLRTLHNHDPSTYTTPVLAEKFKISPEAVRRILKSRWEPSEGRKQDLVQREKQAKLERHVERRQKEWDEAKAVLGGTNCGPQD